MPMKDSSSYSQYYRKLAGLSGKYTQWVNNLAVLRSDAITGQASGGLGDWIGLLGDW